MAVQEVIQSIAERLQSSATVKTVYGEPVAAEGKTVIPVAKVAYGFGAGTGKRPAHGEEEAPEGGGGGGGVSAKPIGVIEVTQQGTRFVPIGMGKALIGAIAVGLGVGLVLGVRACRNR